MSTNFHISSLINKKAKIDKNVSVGPYSVIGPNVKIGKNVMGITVTNKDDIYYFEFQFGLVLQMTKIKEVAIINVADKIEKYNNRNKN